MLTDTGFPRADVENAFLRVRRRQIRCKRRQRPTHRSGRRRWLEALAQQHEFHLARAQRQHGVEIGRFEIDQA